MKKIYTIMQGEYSDRCIVGYTDTEEKAREICASHNASDERWTGDYEYEEVEYMDGDEDVTPFDVVNIWFRKGYR